MENLNFDNGLKTYCVNGVREITFNPTDSAFVEKLFNAFDTLDKKQSEYEHEASAAKGAELFQIARKRDAEMRETIDQIFGENFCKDVFGDCNVYAFAGGCPIWCNFILSVIETVDNASEKEYATTNPRLQNTWASIRNITDELHPSDIR